MMSKFERLKDVSIRVGGIIVWILAVLAVLWGEVRLLDWAAALLVPHGTPRWFFCVVPPLLGLLVLLLLRRLLLLSIRTLSYHAELRLELPSGRPDRGTPSPTTDTVVMEELAGFLPAKYVIFLSRRIWVVTSAR